jgi:hypothetical protein
MVLRTASGAADFERVARINGEIHIHSVAELTRALTAHFPGIEPRDVIFVEDTQSGAAVSTLMLVPWVLYYDGIPVPAGEMAIVGTLESYRKRGLIRGQVIYFMERLRERSCLISHIQGIPYYYRQFGYEYAIPLEGGLLLSGRELPAQEADGFCFRAATIADVSLLAGLYDAAAADLEIRARRTAEEWRYIFDRTPGTETEGETWLIEGESEPPGYFRLPAHHFGDALTVNEVSRLSYDQALAVLHRVVALAGERNKPGVRLNLPVNSTIMRAARAFGADDLGAYAWQIHLPDVAALLKTIGPVLEKRVAASPFAGLTRQLQIGFYRNSATLDFVAGKLSSVAASGPSGGETNMPPEAFVKLVLGYKTLDELHSMYPDFGVAAAERLLLATLFPPMNSFLYSPY